MGIDRPGVSRSTDEGSQAASVSTGPDLSFFDAVRDVVLFCRDAAGRPIGYPMRTTAYEPRALTFTTYRKSAKVRHIERDPRVSVLATDKGAGGLRWQCVEGRAAVVVPSDEEIERIMGTPGRAGARSAEPRVPEGMTDFVKQRLREGKRVFVRVGDIVATAPVRASEAGSRA